MSSRTSPPGRHSNADLNGQSFRVHPKSHQSDPKQSSIAARYGAEVLRDGYTAIPNLLIRHSAAIGISLGEVRCILVICSFWWDVDLPHPAVATIAAAMGRGVRQVQSYLNSLQRKGLLTITATFGADGSQRTNVYDLHRLFVLLAEANTPHHPDGAPAASHGTPTRSQPAAPPSPHRAAGEGAVRRTQRRPR